MLRIVASVTVGFVQSSPHTPCAEIGTRSVPSTILATLVDASVLAAQANFAVACEFLVGPPQANLGRSLRTSLYVSS